jgi:hypothetical protein
MRRAPTVIAAVSCFVAVCEAATPAQVPDNLLACSRLQDPGERVRCYDKQIADMKAAAASSAPAPAPAPAAGAPAGAATAGSTPASSPAVVAPTPAQSAAAPRPAPAGAAPASGEVSAAPAATQPFVAAPASAASASAPVSVGPASAPASVAPASAPVPAAPAPARAAAAPGSESVAGTGQQSFAARFGEDSIPDRLRPKTPKDERVLLSRITEMREVSPNVFVFWLANGQIWRHEGTERGHPVIVFFRAGYDARIEKGSLGSYQMSTTATGAKNWVLVERIH